MLNKYIFGELPLDEFCATYIDRKPLLLRAASLLPSDLNIQSIDEYLLCREGSLHEFVRIVEAGRDVLMHANPQFFTESQKKFINKSFHNGATIKVEGLETRHPLVAGICRSLESFLGGDSYAMTFLTPAGQTAFNLHFDPVSSIIIQLSGAKDWVIYDELVQAPTRQMNRPVSPAEVGAPLMELKLFPGDVLYIPAGFTHGARCVDEHSLHLTIGLETPRAASLFSFALTKATETEDALRQYLYKNTVINRITIEKARTAFVSWLQNADIASLLESFSISASANKHEASRHALYQSACAEKISPSSLVRRVQYKDFALQSSGNVLKLVPSSTISYGRPLLLEPPCIELPLMTSEELTFLRNCVVPVEIAHIPGPLDQDSKVLLCRELIRHGILEIYTINT